MVAQRGWWPCSSCFCGPPGVREGDISFGCSEAVGLQKMVMGSEGEDQHVKRAK